MGEIKFGTDGWRAVIGEDFTEENVSAVIQAFCDIYPDLPEYGRPVVVGYDRRRMSKEAAELAASILTGNGIKTMLSEDFCPTPCVSWMVKEKKGAAGIMVTASHNPPQWNGIKFKESYGGAASPDYTRPIEERIKVNIASGRRPKKSPIPNGDMKYFSAKTDYIKALRALVDIKLIRDSKFKILHEPMYGSGTGFLEEALGFDITAIHTEADPTFGGRQPEPIPPHVNEALKFTKDGGFDICIINDGDADRIGAGDENGVFVNPHQIFALLLRHFVERKGWRGKVIKSITTTRMVDNLCKKYGLPLDTTPVGFKYISPSLNKEGVLMGGEESGGIGIPRHICERDGLLCGLFLLEIMSVEEKRIGELVEGIQREVGPFFYKRIDLHLSQDEIKKVREKLPTLEASRLLDKDVIAINRMDGCHFLREDDSWLLIRASGTEPLVRTYSEARSPEDAERLLALARELIGV